MILKKSFSMAALLIALLLGAVAPVSAVAQSATSTPGAATTAPAKAQPATKPAIAPKAQSGQAQPNVIPSDVLQKLMQQLGLTPQAAQAPTPKQLEQFYHSVWRHTSDTYHDPSKLTNWGAWEKKYDGKLNTTADLETALSEMLGSLGDRWTKYVTSAEIKEAMANDSAGIESLGIALDRQSDGSYRIDYLAYDSPGYNSNLRRGDTVVSIGGTALKGLSQSDVDKLLLGKEKSAVEVVYHHDNKDDKLSLTFAKTPDAHLMGGMLPNGVAIVRLPDFEDPARARLLMQGLLKAEQQTKGKLKGLILDLRGNPGGRFDVALDVASIFMPSGTIVTATTRDGRMVTKTGYEVIPPFKHDFTDRPELAKYVAALYDVPMVVLVDNSTASAAEILSGALKDNKRAIVIGTTTYGKGVGYSQDELPTGGVLTITSLDYVTPSGFNLSNKGLAPDVVVEHARGSKDDEALDAAVDVMTKLAARPNVTNQHAQSEDESGGIDTSKILGALAVAGLLLGVTLWGLHERLRKQREAAEKQQRKELNQG